MKILLGYLNAKVRRENIFKPTIGNENPHQDCSDNGVRIVNLATSRNLFVKSSKLLHRNIHTNTWASPDGKTYKQIEHILIDRRWQSSILDVRVSEELTVILITIWWLQKFGKIGSKYTGNTKV
jgi:hypothetical protein